MSFFSERFAKKISKYEGEKMLIVDEAHRFTQRKEELKDEYEYLLGLSATPYRGKNTESGEQLMNFFGGRVCNLPLENVLGKYLVNYYYYPIIISATEEEEENFNRYSAKIAGCFRNGVLIDKDNLIKYTRNRLRIISMAEEKTNKIQNILNKIEEKDHFIVYCGDGKLFDSDKQKEIRHIQFAKNSLDKRGYKSSQFTASENMYKRMELVESFNLGEISALAAIRCLDEGINIPSIKGALILSSNDDYREFVQRRGRILRTYKDKEYANIYDVIVLPSLDTPGMAKIELRRYLEYARLAINSEENLIKLQNIANDYGLSIDELKMFENENTEEETDE